MYSEPIVTTQDNPLKVVKLFTYLGSVISYDNSLDTEVEQRVSNANASFGRLDKRLWSVSGVKLSTKCKVYRAIVLTALLYSSESYTLYRRHIKNYSWCKIDIFGKLWGFPGKIVFPILKY